MGPTSNAYVRQTSFPRPPWFVAAVLVRQDIALLWKDKGVQATYNERNRYWLLDAASYYFDNVARSEILYHII